jgi:hypothetical protein
MNMVTILLAFPLSFWLLWVFYLAVMNLKRAGDAGQLTKTAKIMGFPVLFVGLLIDFLVNIFVASFIFLELPQETLVTARLARHIKGPDSWRKKVAKWICSTLLDSFDPSGKHCE